MSMDSNNRSTDPNTSNLLFNTYIGSHAKVLPWSENRLDLLDSVVDQIRNRRNQKQAHFTNPIESVATDSAFGLDGPTAAARSKALSIDALEKLNEPSSLALSKSKPYQSSKEHLLLDSTTIEEVDRSGQYPFSLTHGFQQIRNYAPSKVPFRVAVHLPNYNNTMESILAVDAQHVHIWRGPSRVAKWSIPEFRHKNDNKSGRDASARPGGSIRKKAEAEARSLAGITCCCYISKHRLLAVANSHMQIKLVEPQHFTELCSVNCPKPLLSLHYHAESDSVIATSIGQIRVFTVGTVDNQRPRSSRPPSRKGANTSSFSVFSEISSKSSSAPTPPPNQESNLRHLRILPEPRFILDDIDDADQWIRVIALDSRRKILYAGADSDIVTFDFNKKGKRLNINRNAHSLSISSMIVHEPTQLLVTGGKDLVVKLWNPFLQLIQIYRDHAGPITGLAFLEQTHYPFFDDTSIAKDRGRFMRINYELPLILSSSEDKTIRLWSLESERCLAKVECTSPIMGLKLAKQDSFYLVMNDKISLWNYHQNLTSFAAYQSRIIGLSRIRLNDDERAEATETTKGKIVKDRILVVAEDGSIRLVSPVTSQTLCIAYPFCKDVPIRQVEYDSYDNRIYSWLNDGGLVIYDSSSNPCETIDYWPHALLCHVKTESPIECLTSVQLGTSSYDGPNESGSFHPFWLVAGLKSGDVISIRPSRGPKQETLMSAHSSNVVAISSCRLKGMLCTASTDGTIKIWMCHVEKQSDSASHSDISSEATQHGNNTHWQPLLLGRSKDRENLTVKPMNTINWNTVSFCSPRLLSCAGTLGQIALTFKRFSNISMTANDNATENNDPSNNSIVGEQVVMYDVKTDKRKQKKEVVGDEYHTGKISQLVFLGPSLNIFASADSEGYVKVWDAKTNALLREAHFGEAITSMTFANDRGDLLVAIRESVYLVRFTVYLPFQKLAQLAKMDLLPEQMVEDPLKFDPTIAFWQRVEQYFSSLSIQKTALKSEMKLNDIFFAERPSEELLNPESMKVRIDRFIRRMRNLSQTEQERSAFNLAKLYEPCMRFTHFSNGGINWSEFVINFATGVSKITGESVAEIAGKIAMPGFPLHDANSNRQCAIKKFNEAPRLDREVDVGQVSIVEEAVKKLLKLKLELEDASEEFIEIGQADVVKKVPKQAAYSLKLTAEQEEIMLLKKLKELGQTVVKSSLQLNDKGTIKVSRLGQLLLNTYAKLHPEDVEDKTLSLQERKLRLERRKKIMESFVQAPMAPNSLGFSKRLEAQNIKIRKKEKPRLNRSFAQSLDFGSAELYNVELDEETSSDESEPEQTAATSKKPALAKVTKPAVAEKKKEPPITKGKAAKKPTEKKAEGTPKPIVKAKPVPLVKPVPPPIKAEPSKEKELKDVFKQAVNIQPKEEKPVTPQPKVEPAPVQPPPVVQAAPRTPTPPTKPKTPTFPEPLKEPEIKVATPPSKEVLTRPSTVELKPDSPKVKTPLQLIQACEWMPMLPASASLDEFVDAILGVIRRSTRSEHRVDATKALLFLFHNYKEEIKDPLSQILNPLMSCGWDTSVQVRAQICASLPGYGLRERPVFECLILHLGDEDPLVKNVAITSLASLGIPNRGALRDLMEEYGMLNPIYPSTAHVREFVRPTTASQVEAIQREKMKREQIEKWREEAEEERQRLSGIRRRTRAMTAPETTHQLAGRISSYLQSLVAPPAPKVKRTKQKKKSARMSARNFFSSGFQYNGGKIFPNYLNKS